MASWADCRACHISYPDDDGQLCPCCVARDRVLGADRMAAGIAVAINARLLDTRSPAADAMLDYCDGVPITVERAWEILGK